MGKIIGIDLGTTNSCVSIMDGAGSKEPKVLTNSEGVRTTPSIVAFTKSGERLVGQKAKNQAVTNPFNTIRSAKRLIGKNYDDFSNEIQKRLSYKIVKGPNSDIRIRVGDKDYAIAEISAAVLQKMKETAEEYLGEKVTDAVITVPAYFSDSERQATKDAGQIAGLNVQRIVNEPTAAALAYGIDKKNKSQKIAVYDLGGGTFDITILEFGDGVFEVKSTNGDTGLGGDDFDHVLVDYMVSEFKKSSGIDLSNDPIAMQRLQDEAEKTKKELSSSKSVDINLPFITATNEGPKHMNMTISRSTFESLIDGLVNKTRVPCENAISDSGFSIDEIDTVILVGGSTRIPKIQELVENIFGKSPNKSVNPDEVVAMGAAIQGGVLSGDVDDLLLLDVTPLSLGIETLGSVMTKLIPRNTTIPTNRKQVFSTAVDNQPAVSIRIFQGEREIASENKLLGNFELSGIQKAPRGVPQIEVKFDIDANGILKVTAKDLTTNKEQHVSIEASSSLSQDEIDKMVKDAEDNSSKDKKYKEIVDLKNQTDSLHYQIKKLLDEDKQGVLKDKTESIQSTLSEFESISSLPISEYSDSDEKFSKLKSLNKKMNDFLVELQSLMSKAGAAQPNSGDSTHKNTDSASSTKSSTDNKSNNQDSKVVDADYEVLDDNENDK